MAMFLILIIGERLLPQKDSDILHCFAGVNLVIQDLTELGLAGTLVRLAGLARGNDHFQN
jgi:hypothetical protein